MERQAEVTDMNTTSTTERVDRLAAVRGRLLDNAYVADTPWLKQLMERKADDAAAEIRLLARQSVKSA